MMQTKIPPYAASFRWYALWLRALAAGKPESEAISLANRAGNICGKDLARSTISSNGHPILLSMAIEGGAARLRRCGDIHNISLSDHGNWRHAHRGALNAAYGRTPYFQHIMPGIECLLASGERSLAGFNMTLHKTISRIITGQTAYTPGIIPEIDPGSPPMARGREIADSIDAEISVIDPLMRYGRETLLALMATTLHTDF